MNKDFLTFKDIKAAELNKLIARARYFKKGKKTSKVLNGKVLGLIFEKESTRTRISFEVAMMRLGGEVIYLGASSSQLSRGESYADTARVLSRYLNGLVLRTSSHDFIEELASNASIPVINGLTDLYHPCQVMADWMTILEKKDLKKIKVSYVGDGNNMSNSWIELALLLDFSLTVACPKGYEADKELRERAKKNPKIKFTNNPAEAAQDCDVINTDTWFSMGQKVSDEKRKLFEKFQVNKNLLQHAKKDVMVLHCLPAHREEEITSEVLDGPHSAVFDQAENRLYVQMALLESLIKK